MSHIAMAFLKLRTNFGYWLLFAVATIGELIIVWRAIPPYRRLLIGEPPISESPLGLSFWILAGSTMVQTAYWLNRPIRIQETFRQHILIGHLANFVGRLNMILVGGIFAATFIVRVNVRDPSIVKAAALLYVLFSAFLYTSELERLGRSLLDSSKSKPSRSE